MIYCGTDIIEIKRIEYAIKEHGDSFLNKIYTSKEIAYCEERNVVKGNSYAARFAAKEALYKAISSKYKNDTTWKDAELLNDSLGRPYFVFYNGLIDYMKDKDIDVSISHCNDYAIATVIINDRM